MCEGHLISLVLQRELLLLQMQRQLLHAALQPAVQLLQVALLPNRRQRNRASERQETPSVGSVRCVSSLLLSQQPLLQLLHVELQFGDDGVLTEALRSLQLRHAAPQILILQDSRHGSSKQT